MFFIQYNIIFFITCSQQNNIHHLHMICLTKPAAYFNSIYTGHHPVQQDGVGAVGDDALERLDAALPTGSSTSSQAVGKIEIKLLSPAAAMQKFGGSAREGSVILVSTM